MAGVHLPPVQTKFALMQSALLVQPVLQAPVPQLYGVQEVVPGLLQVPVPLHVDAGVSVEPVQVAAAHCVPEANSRQAPFPSQAPSRPQLVAATAVHWSSGSLPAATFEQTPEAFAQLTQVPEQAVEQQVP